MALRLKLSCGPNPRLDPLLDGTVKSDRLELEFDVKPVPVLFYENLHDDAFEVSEMSLSETLLAIDRREQHGQGKWDWVAVPIYLSRAHAWVNLQVHEGSGIESFADLGGKRVAVPDYDMTAALWMRATLKDLYGIEASDIEWFNMRTRGLSHGIELGLDADPPPGVTLNWMSPEQDAAAMFERGDFDAGFGVYEGVTPGEQIRPLLPDGGQQIIVEYYQRTGWFQPNHHYVIQRRIAEEHPWLASELHRVLEESKRVAYERAGRRSNAYLYFAGIQPDEQAAIFGDDPYPCSLEAMRPTLERLERASREQGLIRRPVDIDAMYHESVR